MNRPSPSTTERSAPAQSIRGRLHQVVAALELVILGFALLIALCGGVIYRYFELELTLSTPLVCLLVLLGLWLIRALVLIEGQRARRRQLRVVLVVLLGVVVLHAADTIYLHARARQPEVDWTGPGGHADFRPAGRELCYPGDNLIVVSIDTLRADHLGCYGYREDTSPNIDRFADQALRLARAHAAVSLTLPSHATMFTSLYPGTHGAEAEAAIPLAPEVTTLAEVLRDAGYRTAAIVDDGQLEPVYQIDQGFQTYDVVSVEGFRTILPLAFSRLEELKEEKFFLFLHTYDVHTPYRPTEAETELFFPDYKGGLSLPITDVYSKGLHAYIPAGPNDVRFVEAAYDGAIRWTDGQIGLLIRRLEELDLDRKTIVVITSDHGEGFGEHLWVARHGYHLWEHLLHVPLLVRFPDRALAGSVFDYQVGLVDLMPTLLELLMLPYDGPLQGASLLPTLEGAETPTDRPLLAENVRFTDRHRDQRAYQLGRYKFVQEYATWLDRLSALVGRSRAFYGLRGRGLYDISTDYDETRNLLTSAHRSDYAVPVAQWLEREMYQLLRSGKRTRKQVQFAEPAPLELPPEELERLRGLGYIQPSARKGR